MNQEAKAYHPVYNDMAFPDDLERSSRTITATCTRVSRESIIIQEPHSGGGLRRLSIRERASLQGFPITYQFFGRSFGEKAKLVGNAIPPTFTYLLGMAFQATPAEEIGQFPSCSNLLRLPAALPLVTKPEGRGKIYPRSRTFRAALPGLRFKSGMRFELANSTNECRESIFWAVSFFYGDSKNFHRIDSAATLLSDLSARLPVFSESVDALVSDFASLAGRLGLSSPTNLHNLQAVWSHHAESGLSPYEISDALGELATRLTKAVLGCAAIPHAEITQYVVEKVAGQHGPKSFAGKKKLEQYAAKILSGLVVAAWFNDLPWHRDFNRLALARSTRRPTTPKRTSVPNSAIATVGS